MGYCTRLPGALWQYLLTGFGCGFDHCLVVYFTMAQLVRLARIEPRYHRWEARPTPEPAYSWNGGALIWHVWQTGQVQYAVIEVMLITHV